MFQGMFDTGDGEGIGFIQNGYVTHRMFIQNGIMNGVRIKS